MGRAVAAIAAATIALAGCAGSPAPEETAPPPTPLPSLRTPTVSSGPTEPPETALPSTPDPESTYQQLMAAVPIPLQDRCRRAQPARPALARVECTPVSGADTLRYQLFDGEAPLLDAFRAVVDALPRGAVDGPGCGRGPGSERLPNGRKACFRQGGEAVVLWTNELAYVLASASRADGGWAALDTFWAEAGPVTP